MDIKSSVHSGVKWMGLGKLIGQLVRWTITFIVIRILSPEDYAVMALSDVVFSFIVLLSTNGFAKSIVQAKDYNKRQLRELFSLIVFVNIVFCSLVILFSGEIASFYNNDKIKDILLVMTVGLFLGALEALPLSLLNRKMKFKTVAIIQMVSAIASSVTTLVLAYLGYGVWSLVYGYLTELFVKTVLLLIKEPVLFLPIFSIKHSKSFIAFGGYSTVTTLLWFLFAKFDVFIAGKFWEADTLGYYAVALQLAMIPLSKLMPVLREVAFPAYSRLSASGEYDRIGQYACTANKIVILTTAPIFFGVSAISPELVNVFLGSKWTDAIFPLQVLTLILPLRASYELLQPALIGIGKIKIALINSLTLVIVMCPFFFWGASLGVTELCLVWSLVYPVVYLINVRRSLKYINYPMKEFLRGMMLPIIASVFMYICLQLSAVLFVNVSDLWRLVIKVLVGAAAFGGVMMMFGRSDITLLLRVFRKKSI